MRILVIIIIINNGNLLLLMRKNCLIGLVLFNKTMLIFCLKIFIY